MATNKIASKKLLIIEDYKPAVQEERRLQHTDQPKKLYQEEDNQLIQSEHQMLRMEDFEELNFKADKTGAIVLAHFSSDNEEQEQSVVKEARKELYQEHVESAHSSNIADINEEEKRQFYKSLEYESKAREILPTINELLQVCEDLEMKENNTFGAIKEYLRINAYITAYKDSFEYLKKVVVNSRRVNDDILTFVSNYEILSKELKKHDLSIITKTCLESESVTEDDETSHTILSTDNDLYSSQKAYTVRQLDMHLLSILNKQSDQSNNQLVYNFISMPIRKRALVYQMLEQNCVDNVDEMTLVYSQSDYIPNVEKVKYNLRKNIISRNIARISGIAQATHFDKLSQAMVLANSHWDAITSYRNIKQQTQSVVDEKFKSNKDDNLEQISQKKNQYEEMPLIDIKDMIKYRTLMLERFSETVVKYTTELQRLKVTGSKDKKVAQAFEKEVNFYLDNLIRINEKIINSEDEPAISENIEKPVLELQKQPSSSKVGKKVAAGMNTVGTGIKDLTLATTASKIGTSLAAASYKEIASNMKEALEAAKEAGTITKENALLQANQIENIAGKAATDKIAVGALGFALAGLGYAGVLLSTINYITGLSNNNWYGTLTEPIDIVNKFVSSSGTTLAAIDGVANISMLSTVAGGITVATGLATTSLGVVNLGNTLYRRGKALQADSYLSRVKKQKEEDSTKVSSSERDLKLDADMIKLQNRIGKKNATTAAFQVVGGSLATLTGAATLTSSVFPPAAFVAAGLGALSLGVTITGIIVNKVQTNKMISSAIDEYLGINIENENLLRKWMGNSFSSSTNEEKSAVLKEIRTDMINSRGYNSEISFYSHIMQEYAKTIRNGLFNENMSDQEKEMYRHIAKSLGIYVNTKKNKPSVKVIYSKLMKA